MPAETVDAIVLGAGFVGVSAALHLQARGRRVALIDRHRKAAGETSFGNAGIIQTEAVMPYVFPRAPHRASRAGRSISIRAPISATARCPHIAPSIWRYYAASTAAGKNATARAMAPLLAAANAEHLEFAREAGGRGAAAPRRLDQGVPQRARADMAMKEAEELKPYGIRPALLDRAALARARAASRAKRRSAAAHYADPLSTPDPEALAQSYAALFVKRGGRMETGDARTLEPASGGWMVKAASGRLAARDVVIALGPWSNELARSLGLRLPFFVKRGYHMHYEAKGNAGLTRPVLDLERGYLVTPMTRGLRLTTGAEFARRDDPPSPIQLDKVEPFARELFPIGARKDAAPWLGRRPCLPDMRPVIGPFPGKPGLWLDFGHHHLGLTLGPVSGRLLAELMSGEAPAVDPAPFRAERFAR